MVAFDRTSRTRPLESAQFRPGALERDEFAYGRLARTRLETHDEPGLERLREPLQRRNGRTVLARLDSRDRGVARAHALGELVLREPELRSLELATGSLLRVAMTEQLGKGHVDVWAHPQELLGAVVDVVRERRRP